MFDHGLEHLSKMLPEFEKPSAAQTPAVSRQPAASPPLKPPEKPLQNISPVPNAVENLATFFILKGGVKQPYQELGYKYGRLIKSFFSRFRHFLLVFASALSSSAGFGLELPAITRQQWQVLCSCGGVV